MQLPIRLMLLGLALASSATAVRAQSKSPQSPAKDPAPAQTLAPIDLSIHPASTAIDLALPPAATIRSSAATPTSPDFLAAPAPLPARSAPPEPATARLPAPPSAPVDLLQSASAEVKRVARWVVDSRDNAGLPFLLVDKVNAEVLAFNPAGQIQAKAPVLLGLSRGDRLLAPNSATMAEMPPEVRITPAGRFVARLAIDSLGKELLVLNYDASISLHPVVKGTPEEHRAERLASPTSQDNRISFGCINVPPAFYTTYVSAPFAHTKGIVYVLPEQTTAGELFGFQPADAGVEPAGAARSAGAVVSAGQPVSTALNAGSGQAVQAPGSN